MIKYISIVTFISGTEKLNHNIIGFYKYISKYLDNCELIIYSDKKLLKKNELTDENIREVICNSTTKYMRIKDSIVSCRYDRILFIDNDIKIEYENLKRAIAQCPEDADLFFGKIMVSSTDTFTEHLIKIDKILSHNIIRPALWNMNIGISIPGQVFIMKRNSFNNVLQKYDTLFDDLTIGICAKENNMTVKRTKSVLGSEKPSVNMAALIKQRIRWAKGFAQTLRFNKNSSCLRYIIIHGVAYHASIAVIDLIEAVLFKYSPYASTILFILILITLSDNDIAEIPYVIAYMMIMPAIHSVWLITLISDLIINMEEKTDTMKKAF